MLLPIGLVETLGFATPIGSTIAGLMFLAVLQIGDDLVDPFANTSPRRAADRDVPHDRDRPARRRSASGAPEPVTPVKGVLW